MLWNKISSIGYKKEKYFDKLVCCYLNKAGVEYPLDKSTDIPDFENYFIEMYSNYFSYNRLTFESYESSYVMLNRSEMVKWDCRPFILACACFIDFESMQLYSGEELEFSMMELEENYEIEEGEWLELKEIAQCIIAIYHNDKALLKKYDEDESLFSTISVLEYTETIIINLADVFDVKQSEAIIRLLPNLLSFFSIPFTMNELFGVYICYTQMGRKARFTSEDIRRMQIFHISHVNEIKKILTKREIEELLHPVSCLFEDSRVVIETEDDIYIVYSSVLLDRSTVPCTGTINPAAVAAGHKLKQVAG